MHNRGKLVIVFMLGLGVVMTAIAVWYNHERTHRAIQLWGSEHANRISQAATVRIIKSTPQRTEKDVNDARGLINVRRSLTEDISYDWTGAASGCEPTWEYMAQFIEPGGQTSQLDYSPHCRWLRLVQTGATAIVRPEFAKVLDEFFAEQFPKSEIGGRKSE